MVLRRLVTAVIPLAAAACAVGAGDPTPAGDHAPASEPAPLTPASPAGEPGAATSTELASRGVSPADHAALEHLPVSPFRLGESGLPYNGGRVLTGPIHVYAIFYGSWTQAQKAPIEALIAGIGATRWWGVVTSYTDSSFTPVSSTVTLQGTASDNYSQGKSLSWGQLQNVAANAVQQGKLPADPNGVYAVFGAADVGATDNTGTAFCNGMCAYHNPSGAIPNVSGNVPVIFVGNGNFCDANGFKGACHSPEAPTTGNTGFDVMPQAFAHELAESATDPDLDAWTSGANEMADLCTNTWTSDTMPDDVVYRAANKNRASLHVSNSQGTFDYYVQSLWENWGSGGCAWNLNLPTTEGRINALNFHVTGDFDGDGVSDILFRNVVNGIVAVWFMEPGTGVRKGASFHPTVIGPDTQIEGVGDFNGDGTSDVLLRRQEDGRLQAMLMHGANPPTFVTVTTAPSSYDAPAAIGDFDGNGTADILWQDPFYQYAFLYETQFFPAAGGSFTTSTTYIGMGPGADWHVQATGDFDGDWRHDLLFMQDPQVSSAAQVWTMLGTSFKGKHSFYLQEIAGVTWRVRGVADVNVDGVSDLVMQDPRDEMLYYMTMADGAPSSIGVPMTGQELSQPDAWKIAEVGSFGDPVSHGVSPFAVGILYRNVTTDQLELVFPTTALVSPPGYTQITPVATIDLSTEVVRY